MLRYKCFPSPDTLLPQVSGNQLVAQPNRSVCALFFVAGPDGFSLHVSHEGQIDGCWEAALGKFHGRARVDERGVIS